MTPTSPPLPPLFFHQEFSDFDSFEAAAKGWNLDFLQLDPGEFRASITQLMTAKVVINRCTLGRRFLQRGETPPGFRTFGLSAGDEFSIKWRGHEVGPEHLMIFPEGQSLESVSSPGFDAFAISISESYLDQVARNRGFEDMIDMLSPADLLEISRNDCSKLRTLLFDLLEKSVAQPRLLSTPEFMNRVENEFVETLMALTSAGKAVENAWEDSPSRSCGFKKAINFMKEQADQAITIAEVQEHAGVSERTLRYAFEDIYGMSPKSYLLHLRLNRLRLDLIRNPDLPIGHLAKRWSFRHMGQLSKDYHKLFGELPSHTKRGTA
ncbi:helix-turn-helix domain-containing protein [Haloferula sp.]|uniref:AraC family transcriptional regulator n=1 Tax=Haloferula sp. TaxID=2497595 RepID=UPI0032A0A017